uniref:Uncharacterized protein n=1 Tax=Oryza glumipatula TaxID=40148 RepID=A0A0E0BKB4_9ORYZ
MSPGVLGLFQEPDNSQPLIYVFCWLSAFSAWQPFKVTLISPTMAGDQQIFRGYLIYLRYCSLKKWQQNNNLNGPFFLLGYKYKHKLQNLICQAQICPTIRSVAYCQLMWQQCDWMDSISIQTN